MPSDISDAEQRILDQIEKTSQIARNNWVALIALMAYLGVTVLAHEDADFFRRDASTQLPLIGISIPVVSFFIAAPLLLSAFYVYLHLYLSSLWVLLGRAPARMGTARLSTRVYPWMMAQGALWIRHSLRRGDGCFESNGFGGLVACLSVLITWLFGPALLGFMWFRSLPNHDVWLSCFIGLLFTACCAVGLRNLFELIQHMAHQSSMVALKTLGLWTGAAVFMCLLILAYPLSEKLTIGRGGLTQWDKFIQEQETALFAQYDATDYEDLTEDQKRSFWRLLELRWFSQDRGDAGSSTQVLADLSEADLTEHDDDWIDYRAWLEAHEAAFKSPALGATTRIENTPGYWGSADLNWRRHISNVRGPNLSNRNLTSVHASDAVLTKADLRDSRMDGANFTNAFLHGARLDRSTLRGATLYRVKAQGADLIGANLRLAHLSLADLRGANMNNAQMEGADLSFFDARGANFQHANLKNARLIGAQLHGSVLIGINLSNADLYDAEFHDAHLAGIQFSEISFFKPIITQSQLSTATGNERTVLHRPFYVMSCQTSRSLMRSSCKAGERAVPTGRWLVECDASVAKQIQENGNCYLRVQDHLDELD